MRALKVRRKVLARRIRIIISAVTSFLKMMGAVSIAIAALWLTHSGFFSEVYHKNMDKLMQYSSSLGFNLQNVYLSGQENVDSEEIIRLAELRTGDPIFTLDLNKIKGAIEQKDWVKQVVVERQLPNTLHIKVTERTPVALWQSDGKIYLLDEEGFAIDEPNIIKFKELILLVGDGAPANWKNFNNIVSSNSKLREKIDSAIRIGERRWNIRLKNGTIIKMPEDDPQDAWEKVAALDKLGELAKPKQIDLRVNGRLYVKK